MGLGFSLDQKYVTSGPKTIKRKDSDIHPDLPKLETADLQTLNQVYGLHEQGAPHILAGFILLTIIGNPPEKGFPKFWKHSYCFCAKKVTPSGCKYTNNPYIGP